ncbi:helix-turn-helix domain-containing protein [Anaerosinus massiliensis]|uniref:helix-turn-helix domain-containing protein n=1 Tax=Massilibacillus massiliensis TaxID=1806837 RepID=UPI0018FECE01|nr:helix-turn-helix transcriptional regulator [Massilibacillus massiliensis]
MRLKDLRLSKNLTQKDVAKYINKTTQAYSLYERCERDPDSATLIKLADLFDVSIDYLLGRTNIPRSNILKETSAPYDLPQEALDRIEEFTELMRLKYQK